jgi:HTH-type transcriptional regulator / antitoxin HipB
MKVYTLDQVQDKLIGKIGTPDRDVFEYILEMDLIGKAIEQTRQQRHKKNLENHLVFKKHK